VFSTARKGVADNEIISPGMWCQTKPGLAPICSLKRLRAFETVRPHILAVTQSLMARMGGSPKQPIGGHLSDIATRNSRPTPVVGIFCPTFKCGHYGCDNFPGKKIQTPAGSSRIEEVGELAIAIEGCME